MHLPLTQNHLIDEAYRFATLVSAQPELSLYGVTDGKAIGTFLEHRFKADLALRFTFLSGRSALGIDFPELAVDMKVTSIAQPQSSCPYKSARQKIFGLGYSLLVFVYSKVDDPSTLTGVLTINHAVFIPANLTADYQLTTAMNEILENDANEEELVALMRDRFLPVDEIESSRIAHEILERGRQNVGYLTISNALQWRLQYRRALTQAGKVEGLVRIL